ncbi:MAG: cobyrinate a,c-diamide synthase [Syntrophomonadaceae bacterium]|nr:cobyrinate a,c-diamide synthase [Syntrophomonadaceae bacterium]
MNSPRIVIAGVHSGVGKTTMTLGIMAALRRKGTSVQPFKVGPDYIDPGLHFYAAGVRSHNLDSWMGSEEVVKTVFAKNAARAQISIIEGVMGFYDTARGRRIMGSTAHIALILNAPVILVVNAKAMAQSCIALVKGYMDYEPRVQIQGVILNNASSYHKEDLRKSLEEELGVTVLGCIPENKAILMPERHLGLLPAEENNELSLAIESMADLMEAELDFESLLGMANNAPNLKINWQEPPREKSLTIGVARDEAFSFYYQDSLDYLQELGASIEVFSPLRDSSIPPVDGLYLGGGFPEMFLEPLGNNFSMIDSIRVACRQSMPILAECGGFMYLTKKIRDFSGNTWPGVGIIPAEVKMTNKLAALGYVEAKALQDSIIAVKGDILRGHEFHYSQLDGIGKGETAYSLSGGKDADLRGDGYAHGNILASYVHLHLRSNPHAAHNFINACRKYSEATWGLI